MWASLRVLCSTVLLIVAAMGSLWLLVRLLEAHMIFYPTRYPTGDWDAPRRAGDSVQDIFFEAEDGVRLHGWWRPEPTAEFTLLFFHGNAGNLSDRYFWVRHLAQLPAQVFIVDYRGYGRSEGSPSEEGMYRDAEAAYRWLIGEAGVPPERLVLYGKSLGGAAACNLALREPVAGVILQSTFTNARDMAAVIMPWLPVGGMLGAGLDNLEAISRIDAPKLIVHSEQDDLVPFWMAERLRDNASPPVELRAYQGAGHNDLVAVFSDALLDDFRAFFSGLSEAKASE